MKKIYSSVLITSLCLYSTSLYATPGLGGMEIFTWIGLAIFLLVLFWSVVGIIISVIGLIQQYKKYRKGENYSPLMVITLLGIITIGVIFSYESAVALFKGSMNLLDLYQ